LLYSSIKGDQEKLAQMYKKFYDIGLDGSEPAGRYPDIHPEVMTTLEDVYGVSLSVGEVKSRLLSHFEWSEGEYTEEINRYYSESLEKMYRRNRRIFGEDFV